MIKKNIRIGIILSYLTILAGIIVTILYTPFMIEKIGKTEHGIYTFVSSIISWFSILTVGVAGAYVRFATKYNAEQGKDGLGKINSGFGLVLFVGAVIGIIGGLVILILLYFDVISLESYSAYEKSIIYQLFVIGIIHLLFSFIIIFYNAYNTYKNRFIVVRGIALLIVIVNPILSIPFLILGYNVVIISFVKLLVDVVSLILYFSLNIFSKEKLFFKKIGNSKEKKAIIKEIVYFCSLIMLYVTIDTINKSTDKIVLGFFGLPNMVSIYGLGRAFLEYAYFAAVYVSANFIQVINQKIVEKKHDEVNRYFIKLSDGSMLLMLFIFGGFAVTGQTFVSSWLANSVYSPEEINQIFWIALILIFINIVPFSQVSAIEIQRGYNKHLKPTIILLVNAITNIIITVLLLYFLPKEFAVWLCLLSTVITTIITSWIILNVFYHKELKLNIKMYYMSLIKRLCFTLLVVFLCFTLFFCFPAIEVRFSKWVLFLLKGSLFTFLYFISLILFERKMIKDIISTVTKKGQIK